MTTKMSESFEFKGAIVAREFLIKNGSVEDQADGVCEAIIRHQNIFVKGYVDPQTRLSYFDSEVCMYSGNITTIGQILQLATILGMQFQFLLRLSN